MRNVVIFALLMVSMFAFYGRTKEEPPKTIMVAGNVRDADGKPVKGATILINIPSDKGKPKSMVTDDDGKYQKEIDMTDSFDLYYQHTDAGRAEVSMLSGKHNQNISIILYTSNQVAGMKPEAILAELGAHENVFAIAYLSSTESKIGVALREKIDRKTTLTRLKMLGEQKLLHENEKLRRFVRDKVDRVIAMSPRDG